MRFLLHFVRGTAQPLRRDGQVLRFDRSVHPSGHDQTVAWGQFIALAVGGLSFCKVSAPCVQVAQRKIGHVESWIGCRQPLKIFLGSLIVSCIAGGVAHRDKSGPVHRIDREDLRIYDDRFLGVAELRKQISIELQAVGILGIDRQRFFNVAAGSIEVAAVHFDQSSQPQKLRPARTAIVQPADLALRDLKMVVSGICISQTLIQSRQIHLQLNAVQRSLGWALG